MPYRTAPIAMAFLLALTGIAFWPAYYSVLQSAPLAFHVHGATATIWIVLLGLQSWSAHRQLLPVHAFAGKASVAYFPLLLAGMGGVLHSMAAATPADPFYAVHGAHLGMIDVIAGGMVAWLFSRALAFRRRPHLHPRYMMATVLFLLAPIIGRIIGGFVPMLQIHGPAEFWKFSYAVEAANLVAIAVAAALYFEAPRHGRPFAVSAAALAVQSVLFPIVGESAAWNAVFLGIGALPLSLVLAVAAAVGLAAAWSGWVAGARSLAPTRMSAA
ncbi:hypothetical protein [Novosphingobium sp. 9U]|uniref:hypothetical protein n=1 Tax=Novosphingobium sp. 9U TaxID=2653158 RepID=UPI0012F15DD8|nr:hypothetical protein [Novosphingobium sp. 9U]VWX54746.1 conserved membrane hypothetical protein [Novosphingobium sp. 9U]